MKKFAMSLLTAGLLISSGLQARDELPGGEKAKNTTFGGLGTETIVLSTFGVGILAAGLANGNGEVTSRPPITSCPDGYVLSNGVCNEIPDPDPTCNGDDELVDGVCIGTTTTVTVTASGSGTTTITVPVTFTYLPTVSG
jgi:hypothetical protein